MTGRILVRGARQHNLKNVDVSLPRDRLVVLTGPSGSGKTSLAFDTICAEGQRRYVESLSVGARRALDVLPRPEVDSVEGLSPTVRVEPGAATSHPRSTVGTTSEVYDFLRLLFARAGTPHCPTCGTPLGASTVQRIVDRALALPEGTRLSVRAPLLRKARVTEVVAAVERLRRDGFVRAVLDGATFDVAEPPSLTGRRGAHDLAADIDRVRIKEGVRQRLTESVELALSMGRGVVELHPEGDAPFVLSDRNSCITCGFELGVLEPKRFSFNDPAGACPACEGLGRRRRVDPDRVVPDPQRSLRGGAVAAWGPPTGAYYGAMLGALLAAVDADADRPWRELSKSTRERLLFGDGVGIVPALERRIAGDADDAEESEQWKFFEEGLSEFLVEDACDACDGSRLNPAARAVTVAGTRIDAVTRGTLTDTRAWLARLATLDTDPGVLAPIVTALDERLSTLIGLGVDYLSLDRPMQSLSAGEAGRVRLATHVATGLVGVTYVLDEPSVGLHPRDTARLLGTLVGLRDRGNSVLVVEHDLAIIRAADFVVDLGPGAGREGGRVMAMGTPDEVRATPGSPTGRCLAGASRLPPPTRRRVAAGGAWIEVEGARLHNLAGIDARFPVGVLTCVTGVSGSGKSTLVLDTLLPAAREIVHGARARDVRARVRGLGRFSRVVHLDQKPIGRTPRSNPATYTGLLAHVREAFSGVREARARGYSAARFSFNVKGGRCETCQGAGLVRVEMHFLPDVYARCPDCAGRRYNRETLDIRYRGRSIADVLDASVEDAAETFAALPRAAELLASLRAVGLGYLPLGQSATTLSAGEAQRLRLATELAGRRAGETLYVLDEPTTGLHAADVEVLLEVLLGLVERGDTVIVIEHDLEVMRHADHVLDLGPEAGPGGGRVVAAGTPEEVARVDASHTGRSLAEHLAAARSRA